MKIKVNVLWLIFGIAVALEAMYQYFKAGIPYILIGTIPVIVFSRLVPNNKLKTIFSILIKAMSFAAGIALLWVDSSLVTNLVLGILFIILPVLSPMNNIIDSAFGILNIGLLGYLVSGNSYLLFNIGFSTFIILYLSGYEFRFFYPFKRTYKFNYEAKTTKFLIPAMIALAVGLIFSSTIVDPFKRSYANSVQKEEFKKELRNKINDDNQDFIEEFKYDFKEDFGI
ncbi:MAG: hypothetical protein ACOCP8_00105 [archaeon]